MAGTPAKNLDLLTGEPIEVQLGGQTYLLPPDVPIPTMLLTETLDERLNSDDQEVSSAAARELYDHVLALFKVFQPEMDRVPLNTLQLIGFLPYVYGDFDPAKVKTEASSGARPTRAGKTKTKSRAAKKPKPRTGSRSSAA